MELVYFILHHAMSPAVTAAWVCHACRPMGENSWANEDGQSLSEFVSAAMSKYLRAQVQV